MAGLEPVKEPDNVTTYNHPQPTNTGFINEKQQHEHQPHASRDAPSPPLSGTEKELIASGDHEPVRFMGYTGTSLTWAVTFFATSKSPPHPPGPSGLPPRTF